jgi:hypothetical protein
VASSQIADRELKINPQIAQIDADFCELSVEFQLPAFGRETQPSVVDLGYRNWDFGLTNELKHSALNPKSEIPHPKLPSAAPRDQTD